MNKPINQKKDTGINTNTILTAMLLGALAFTSVQAQQTTGTPGSPSATPTIDGKQLPPPDPKFGGIIKENAAQSNAWWAPRIVPPKQAPNILLILTDDVGYGAPSTFGGVIPTPALDRIANNGLRYNNFHTAALYSPTRAGQPPPFGSSTQAGSTGNSCGPESSDSRPSIVSQRSLCRPEAEGVAVP